MKIIKIKYGGPKVYSYLLDNKVQKPPHKGAYLKRVAGSTTYGAYYDFCYVEDVVEVDRLPDIVTAGLTINEERGTMETYTFKKETLMKIRSIREKRVPSEVSKATETKPKRKTKPVISMAELARVTTDSFSKL